MIIHSRNKTFLSFPLNLEEDVIEERVPVINIIIFMNLLKYKNHSLFFDRYVFVFIIFEHIKPREARFTVVNFRSIIKFSIILP